MDLFRLTTLLFFVFCFFFWSVYYTFVNDNYCSTHNQSIYCFVYLFISEPKIDFETIQNNWNSLKSRSLLSTNIEVFVQFWLCMHIWSGAKICACYLHLTEMNKIRLINKKVPKTGSNDFNLLNIVQWDW